MTLEELSAQIAGLQQETREDHLDLVRRLDRIEATQAAHGRRISNIEQAIVTIVPALRVG